MLRLKYEFVRTLLGARLYAVVVALLILSF
ncbi:hypothetical protein SAMN05192541_13097 [Bradyrhizobium arachidis]|nr:hypothetical protein SAMN05192541_13097 [Bradyrhizobium arachidis]